MNSATLSINSIFQHRELRTATKLHAEQHNILYHRPKWNLKAVYSHTGVFMSLLNTLVQVEERRNLLYIKCYVRSKSVNVTVTMKDL